MKKLKVLLLGHSNLAKKRLINSFIKKKILFSVSSISEKKKIKGAYAQYNSYEDGLKKSLADIVYISLPNSLHYKWAKKSLEYGYHVIVDKPICEKMSKVNKLVNLSKKKNKLLSEAIFFNYHKQFYQALKLCEGVKNINHINANFIIPNPKKNNFRNSTKMHGGVLMDMGSYISSIVYNFYLTNLKSKKIIIKKDKFKLINSIDFIFDFNDKIFTGKFKFGGEYQNELLLYTKKKIIKLNRVFSPPSDVYLSVTSKEGNKKKSYKVPKDDCFLNYFNEVSEMIQKKKYQFYLKKIVDINKFINLLKT